MRPSNSFVCFLIVLTILMTGCTNPSIENQNREKVSDTNIENDYLGVSFTVIDDYYLQRSSGYSRNPLELITFTDRTGNKLFTIRMKYEKFDKDAYEVLGWGEFNRLPSFEILPSVIATPPPNRYKITDMQTITINGLDYYTYSVEFDSKRQDVFIYPREDTYYLFIFYNQDIETISSIMTSVKFTKSAYIDVSSGQSINNTAIGLRYANIPTDWNYNNSNDATIVSYNGDLGFFKMTIAPQDDSDIFDYMKSRCDIYSQEWSQGKVGTFDEDKEYLITHFGCENASYGAKVSETKALYCYMPKNSDGTYVSYAYYSRLSLFVKAEYSGSDALKLYYDMILDSMGFTNAVMI